MISDLPSSLPIRHPERDELSRHPTACASIVGAGEPRLAIVQLQAEATMINGVQDVYYNVSDMGRALEFYRDVLGLPVDHQSEWWSSLDVAGVRLGLHWTGGDPVPGVPGDGHGPYTGGQVTLRVDDIAQVISRLRAAGTNVSGEPFERPWGTLAVFRDPDGNYLTLMEPKKAQGR